MALSDYKYYKKLTIDGSKIDEDLTHFPVAVPLSSGACSDVFEEVGPDYLKMAVFLADETTQLFVEVEQWDVTGTRGLLWASRDTWTIISSSDPHIYLAFDSSAADNTAYVGTPGNRTEVWNSDFAARYGMAQDPSGGANCIIDSTANANHGTPNSNMTSDDLVDGLIGKALDFDGSDDYIDLLALDSTPFTISTSFFLDVYGDGGAGNTILDGDEIRSTWILREGSGTVQLVFSGSVRASYSGVNIGEWYRAHIRVNTAGELQFIINNVIEGSVTGLSYNPPANPIRVGRRNNSRNDREMDGKQQNIVISNTALSDDWIKADYHAQTDNLLTFGATKLSTIGYFEGYTVERNTPVNRTVYMYRRATGELLDKVTSSGTNGYFYIETSLDEPHNLVCLASGTNYSDLFYSKVYPTLF